MGTKGKKFEVKCDKCENGAIAGQRCPVGFGRGYVLTKAGLAAAQKFDAKLYELLSR